MLTRKITDVAREGKKFPESRRSCSPVAGKGTEAICVIVRPSCAPGRFQLKSLTCTANAAQIDPNKPCT
jgi:hypothetical protein